MFGRNQWIVIVGGLAVLAAGFGAMIALGIEAGKAFLDFAGSFGWKVIVGATGGSAVIKAAASLKK